MYGTSGPGAGAAIGGGAIGAGGGGGGACCAVCTGAQAPRKAIRQATNNGCAILTTVLSQAEPHHEQ